MLDAHEQARLEVNLMQADKDKEAMAHRINELEAERDRLRSKLDFILGHIYAIGRGI